MAATIPSRKVYKFRMEPTGLEALELERAASVARFVYSWALGQSLEYYQQHGKSKPWGGAVGRTYATEANRAVALRLGFQMLQQALADLRRAYINFFEGRAKFPRVRVENERVYVKLPLRRTRAIMHNSRA